ncbi:hypothetical protein V5P93_004888 [Actinokineospora auranticolor]|uniref:Uncharacterized protein n=1 Tax=Actinokineospora auranticolor TaxID=155976 RepID=A0A2S6GNU2_9PSEU|nr:hypothetical protein [Actinokineospora auranticolor]PPK66850.1 hypothetical protein CLV40_109235 [Actinokineospora auranticolor]
MRHKKGSLRNRQWLAKANTYQADQTDGLFTTAYWTCDFDAGKYEVVGFEPLQYIDCTD